MADTKYMESQVYDVSLGGDVYKVYCALGGSALGYMTMTPRAEPGTPDEGMVYYDSTANKLKVYTGSSWETITSS